MLPLVDGLTSIKPSAPVATTISFSASAIALSIFVQEGIVTCFLDALTIWPKRSLSSHKPSTNSNTSSPSAFSALVEATILAFTPVDAYYPKSTLPSMPYSA